MTNEGPDLICDFEEKLKSFIFNATTLSIENWSGTDVIENVQRREHLENSKSTEENILNRLKLWLDACRVDVANDERVNEKTFLNPRRNKMKNFQLRKSISLESIDIFSTPVDGAINEHLMKKKRGFTFSGNHKSKYKASKSTTDLRTNTNEIHADVKYTDSSSSSTVSTEDPSLKTEKRNKSNFLYNLFGKKSVHTNVEDAKAKNNKWHWRTPKLHRKRNSKAASGTLKHVRSGADIGYEVKPLPSKLDIDYIFGKEGGKSKTKNKMIVGSTPLARKHDKKSIHSKGKCNTDEIRRRKQDIYGYRTEAKHFAQSTHPPDEYTAKFDDKHKADIDDHLINCSKKSNRNIESYHRMESYDENYTDLRDENESDSDEEIFGSKIIQDEYSDIKVVQQHGKREQSCHISIRRKSVSMDFNEKQREKNSPEHTVNAAYYIDSIRQSRNSIKQCTSDIKTILNLSDIRKSFSTLPNQTRPNTATDPPKMNTTPLNVSTPDISRITRNNGNNENRSTKEFRYSLSDSLIRLANDENHRLEYIGYI